MKTSKTIPKWMRNRLYGDWLKNYNFWKKLIKRKKYLTSNFEKSLKNTINED